MPFNGSGIFNLLYNWENDAANNIPITASRMDGQESDMASTGFGNCITRDGQGVATADIPWGGFKITGLANATLSGDAVNLGQFTTGTSITANGCQTLPNGLILQWGNDASTSTASAVTFPVAFPNACFSVTATIDATSPAYCAAHINSTSGFTIYKSTSNFAQWLAVGW